MNKKIMIDMDDVLCDFSGAKYERLSKFPEMAYPQSQMDFFRTLKPLPRAIESFLTLSDIYDVYILTAPSIMNPLSYTEKRLWVEDNLGLQYVSRLIICSDKSLLNGDYLIDDNVTGNMQDYFRGEFIHFGSEEFKDWEKVMDYFKFLHDVGTS